MKLATFEHQGDPAAGVIVDGSVHALCDLDATLPRTLEQVLGGGEAVIRQVRRAARNARGGQTSEVPVQMWFNEQTSCITGPYDPVQLPSVSEQLDFEGELGMVIGKRCRRVSVSDAHKVIAGYIVVNDLSVRD